MAVATFLVVCLMKKKKLKLSTVYTSLKGPYFYPTKQLTVKDEVFLSMLENCQSVGPCYVITDPSLRGRWTINNTHDIIYYSTPEQFSPTFFYTSDNPIVYASEGFCKFTGYTKEEIEGRNCRFLQGKNSSPEDVSRIRTAIEKKEEVSVCLLNYKKDGSTFLNQVSIKSTTRSDLLPYLTSTLPPIFIMS